MHATIELSGRRTNKLFHGIGSTRAQPDSSETSCSALLCSGQGQAQKAKSRPQAIAVWPTFVLWNFGRSQKTRLASRLSDRRSAELQRGVSLFATASAESDGNNDSKNECTLHNFSPVGLE
jgi:hypothetical protein